MFEISRFIINDILKEVNYAESVKKTICKEILMVKNDSQRKKLIYSFLNYDLDKHTILEQAALFAIDCEENFLIRQLELLYKHCEGSSLLDKIQQEIANDELFLDVLAKAIDDYHSISFSERRLLKEITKYVITQARFYNKFSPGLH